MISVNGIYIKPTVFPDRTSQVWQLPDSLMKNPVWDIAWEFEHEGELMHLAQLRDLAPFEVNLFMPYLPYARQDKTIGNDQSFALNTFSWIINALQFNSITCLDAHSDVAEKLIHGLKVKYPSEIHYSVDACDADLVCYPDKGALEKYSKVYPYKFIYGEKERDPKTGWIKKYKLIGGPVVKGKKILMVDDICDGGMTFILLAKDLYKAGAKEVHLHVTHGIFSKGIEPLEKANIKQIFTRKGAL